MNDLLEEERNTATGEIVLIVFIRRSEYDSRTTHEDM